MNGAPDFSLGPILKIGAVILFIGRIIISVISSSEEAIEAVITKKYTEVVTSPTTSTSLSGYFYVVFADGEPFVLSR